MPNDDVLRILRKYEPLNAEIDLDQTAPEAELMYRIVTDDAEYEQFKAAPAAFVERNGIDPDRVDSARFEQLVDAVRIRIKDRGRLGPVAESVSTKESNEGQSSNWDHSSSWFTNKDGWNVMHEAGHSESKSSSSEAGTSQKFDGFGFDPGQILRNELNLLFFPAQPLVTPALIEQIRGRVEGPNQ